MTSPYADHISPLCPVNATHLCTRFATPDVEASVRDNGSLPKVTEDHQMSVRPASPHLSIDGSSALALEMKPAKVFDASSICDEEMNADLLTCDKVFNQDSRYTRRCFVHPEDTQWYDYVHHCRRACRQGDIYESGVMPAGSNHDWGPSREEVWENYLHDSENEPYYQIYPKFEHLGDTYVWQAKAFHDGHLFLIAIRKYCLDRFHKEAACLTILKTTARIILNIYQGYYRALGTRHNYCKLKFLKHFVTHFFHNLKEYRAACKKNARFIPHGSFMEAVTAARGKETWGEAVVSVIANWDVTKDFIVDGIKKHASNTVTEYADRCSILADILNAANTLYKNLIAFKIGDVAISQVIMSINSFYRSLDFTNPWANELKRTLASIFPSFSTATDNASRLRDLINYLVEGCSQKFRDMFDSLTTLVNGFGTVIAGPDREDEGLEHNGRFMPFGPLQPILDICDSDLGFMAAKLTALVASFCAIMTIDGKVPELSYEGLSKFSRTKVFPVLITGIVAGTATGFLTDFDKVLSLMWQAVDSIFKGDFGRFVGVDSYTQIFELYSFISMSYGGIPPTQDTLSFSNRDHFKCPVSRMLPVSIINSSDPDWRYMIEDLEGILAGHATAPKDWATGMKVVANGLNAKLQKMASKVSLSKEMKTKFAQINSHLQALTRNVSTLPSPHKAAGMSFVFSGDAGIGKSKALGDTFIKTVTSIIHTKAHKYGYPDIGNWRPGDPIDHKCIDRQRRTNYMLNKQGGVPFLYSHVEDFDPCVLGQTPPENNLVHRIMLTGDGVSANQEAAALETKKGDAVKGDNHYRILAGFYSDNRSDAGVQELAVCTPAVVRRTVFIQWHLKAQYADGAKKLDTNHQTVKLARNASDTSSIYNKVTVYTFVRLSGANGEFVKGEQMQKIPVSYTFVSDQAYGPGNEAVSFKKGRTITLKEVCINTFFCYINDMVAEKYENSFRHWRAEEVKTSLKSESSKCACANSMTVRHCPICAGLHEFDAQTGDLVVMSPRIRDPGKIDRNPSLYGDFSKRSILMSLRKIDKEMVRLFPVLLYSATLRPVTRRIFEALPLKEMTNHHQQGNRWLFAERGGAFIESSALDYLLSISAGVIYHSADRLEEWWKDQFDTDYTLAQLYFFLVRYLIFTPSEYSEIENTSNTSVTSELQNVSLELLWKSTKVSGVDCNGVRLIDRINVNDDSINPSTRRDDYELNSAKATYVSITKCLIFDALLSDSLEFEKSHFDFVKMDFAEITSSFFSIFGVSPNDYFKSFVSVFVPNRDNPLAFEHKPIAVSKRKDVLCTHQDVCARIFKEHFWEFDLEDSGESSEDSSDEQDTETGSINPLVDYLFAPSSVTSVGGGIRGYDPKGGTCIQTVKGWKSLPKASGPQVNSDERLNRQFALALVSSLLYARIASAITGSGSTPPMTFKPKKKFLRRPDLEASEVEEVKEAEPDVSELPTYEETYNSYENPHSDDGLDDDDGSFSVSWVSRIDLACCKGVEARLMDGSVKTFHDPKCVRCGPWCERVFLHLDRDPSSLIASSEFVENVDTRSRDRDWEDASKSAYTDDVDEDMILDLNKSCPMTCCASLWRSSLGCPMPMLAPSESTIAVSIRRFHDFLSNLREAVRQSCFKEIPKLSIKAILYTLSPLIAAGAFYRIFYKVLTAGDDGDSGFIPHGVESKIPDGENYWSEKSLVKSHKATEVHNTSNTHGTCHGSTLSTVIKNIFGKNKKCCTSRIVTIVRKKGENERFALHGFAYDCHTIIAPSHFFSDSNLDKGEKVIIVMTLDGRNGQPSSKVEYEVNVNQKNVYFDKKLDLCMIYHGLAGIHGLNPLNLCYNSDMYCSVKVDGTYWHPSPTGLMRATDEFFNRDDDIAFFGNEAPNYQDSKVIMEHLRDRPMDGLLVRKVKKGDHKFKHGDCGLPVVFTHGTQFPVLGFYIGDYSLDDSRYNLYVPLTWNFLKNSSEALGHLKVPGVTNAREIGFFSKTRGKFDPKMNHVIDYSLDDPELKEQLAEAKRVSGSDIKRGDKQVSWANYLNGLPDDRNVAAQTDLFQYSGSKSGVHVSLPSFDSRNVKGVFAHHDNVRGIFPIIASDNDVYFHPEFLYLGATPWMDEGEPHYTFSGELPVGMVGPGVEKSGGGGSESSMSLAKEVAKCMVHGHIEHELVRDAASRVYEHYFNVIEGLLHEDSERDDDDPLLDSVHNDLRRLLTTTIEEQFVGVKNEVNGDVIVPKMDHTSSWGSNNKPPVGSSKRDVYEIGDNDELLIYDSAIPAWEAFTASVFCFTCGVVPENQITTCFTKRECYPVTMPSSTHKYPIASNALDFYTAMIGEEKAKELLATDVKDDQKIRDIFHSVDDFKVKVKSRMVSNLPGAVNVAFRMFLLPLAYLFTTNPIEFDMVAGLDMGSCHFEQSTNQIFFDGYDEATDTFLVFDADVSAWDKIMPANLMRYTLMICIELVLGIHEYFGTSSPRLRSYADALLEWWDNMSLFYGGAIIPISVMPSGFIFTLPLNSMMNQVLQVCTILKFANKHSIPPPVDFTDWIRHKALGDDSQTAVKPAFVEACKLAGAPIYSAVAYSEIMRSFGITATMGNKSDTTLPYQEPGELVFLQHVMIYVKIPCYTLEEVIEDRSRLGKFVVVGAAPLKAPVLVKLLAKQDSSSTVERKDLLRSQVYTILGELVPYGKVRWQRFVDAVRNYYHPVWKPKSEDHQYAGYWHWNFWLDRYVKKFCSNGRIDDYIVQQRKSNHAAFESLKKKINPDGIDLLDYDPIE